MSNKRHGVIYKIASHATGRLYIGSTVRGVKQRFAEHLHYLRRGKHHSKHLQRIYNKHGEHDLECSVVCEVEAEQKEILALEQWHIDNCKGQLLNTAPVSDSVIAASLANKGRVMGAEERARRSASAKASIKEGRRVFGPWDEARKQAHSERLKGRKMPPVSDETRRKISDAHKLRHALLGTTAESPKGRASFVSEEAESWVCMHRAGMSYREIERKTGRSRCVIAREIKRRSGE